MDVQSDFIEAEQTAMKAMAVGIAQAQHSSLSTIADHAKTLKDGVADGGKVYIDANADAVREHDNSQVGKRHIAADSLTSAEIDYQLAAFDVDVDKTEELVGAARAAAAAQLAAMSNWLSTEGGTSGGNIVDDIADHSTMVDAAFQKRLSDLSVEQTFIDTTTPYEQERRQADHASEAVYGTAVVNIAHASKERISGYLNGYEKAVNSLDRQWVTDASANDVAVVEAIADALKTENLNGLPNEASWADYISPYITQVSQWPTSPEGIPSVVHPGLSPHLTDGDIDISQAEEAFAPQSSPDLVELEITEEEPPTVEETTENYYVQNRVNQQPNTPNRYEEGQTIVDQGGATVGTIVIVVVTRAFHDWVNGYPQWANQPAASLAVTLW